ncbi:MAG: lipid biosynthesis acyltransferase [Bacteroidetes bacterium]|nr:lipid biosynthesis acyltransferase [Bacteroidota bacterium]
MYYLSLGFIKLVSLLPFWVLYGLSDFSYLIVYYIAGYRKKVVRDNLKRSFPEKTEKGRLIIERKFYHHFCDLLFESIKSATISRNEILRRMKILNYNQVIRHYDEGKSVILMTSHYANWEWTYCFNLMLPKDKPFYQIYKKLSNNMSEKIVQHIRTRFGSVAVEVQELFPTLSTMKTEGRVGMIGMVSDQSPARNGMKYFSQFLNQHTPVITGTELIAKKYDFPVYYAQIRKVKRGFYTCNLLPICVNPAETEKFEITEKYIRILENEILAEPAYWLWSHRRWKYVNN